MAEMLRELEAAAQIVLAPPNLVTAEQRQTAEQVFLNFRKTRTPYQLCRQILELSTMDYILFETAGLLNTALIQEWSILPESDISSLRQYLLHYIINRSTLAPYVKAKILQVIAIIIKRGSVADMGRERGHILNELESLIMNGDLPKKILGCNLLFAIMQEYSMTNKSSNIGLTQEVHFNEKAQFEETDMKRIFKLSIQVLDELVKKDFDESTLSLLKHLLPIMEGIFSWGYMKVINLPKRFLTAFEMNEYAAYSTLKLPLNWQDVILDPALLDLLFTLYWKVRTNPQLAHHARNCLIQLSSLGGKIMNSDEVRVQYITNYVQRFLKILSSIDIIDQEATGIANIFKKTNVNFRLCLGNLPPDLLKTFREEMTRLTCVFIEGAAQEESECADNRLYMDAMECMLETWLYMLSLTTMFSTNLCRESIIQIFNTYLRCHLSPPEGIRRISSKNLTEEETDVEEDDKKKFKDHLQIIGTFAKRAPTHSLTLLAQLLEDRIHKLRDNLNKLVGQRESRPASMDDLYEDLHWLILIAGHSICIESEDEIEFIPSELMQFSMQQIRQGVNVNHTLEFLISSQDIQSNTRPPFYFIDDIIRLVADVLRLCAIEKTAISINFENILSPVLSSTIIWFLQKWSKTYLLPNEVYYSEISTTILQAFGEDSPAALWTVNIILEKVICNINAFKSEPVLIESTIQLLIALTATQKKATYLLKTEQFTHIMELAMKGQYDFPRTVKRGLMQALVQVGTVISDKNTEQHYWSQTIGSLQNRCKQLISSNNLMSYHQEEIRVQIIDILECFIGVAQGMRARRSINSVYQRTYPLLVELPQLLSLYHNYQEIVQLILEVFCEYTRGVVCSLSEDDCAQVFDICLQMMQTYARYNSNRLTVDSTAEEDSYQDILLLIQLLTNLLNKEMFLDSDTEQVRQEGRAAINVILYGLNIIMPMMTTNLLQFPSLCIQYFKMLVHVCNLHSKEICELSTKLLQQLLASVVSGLCGFGREVSGLCCEIIQLLTRHIYSEIAKMQPRNDIMAPFLSLLMNLILSHQLESSVIPLTSLPFYYLVCCYQEQYQQFVQNILSSQTDQQIVQRLANAFTELTANVDLSVDVNKERVQKQNFKDNFEKFIMNVLGFLIIK